MQNNLLSRRAWLRAAGGAAVLGAIPFRISSASAQSKGKPNSKVAGVQLADRGRRGAGVPDSRELRCGQGNEDVHRLHAEHPRVAADTPGPQMFQDHDNPVRFRNVWIRPPKD
jgi:hypothetical protein